MRRVAAVAAVVVGAVGLRLVYGGGTLGYDAIWALVWGRELAHLGPVVFETAGAPTPHPLAIAVSALASPLGDTAIDVILALSWLAFAALGALAFALGRALFSPWVGAVFAALLLTRPQLVLETQQALLDIPFVALVLAAMLVTAKRGRAGWAAPAFLAAAGLLRPEAWLLSVAWVAWAAPARPARDRPRLVLLALAAPLLWALQDLAVTGDLFYSLHATRGLADELARPRGLDSAIRLAPGSLRSMLTEPVVWLGLAGAAVALVRFYARTVLPAAVAGIGLLTFVLLGSAGLPVLTRYLLLPAAMLVLWCAVLVAGFTIPEARERAWPVVGALTLLALVVTAPSQLDSLRAARAVAAARGPVSGELQRLLSTTEVRAALARCGGRISVPDPRPKPLAAFVLRRASSSIAVQGTGPSLRIAYANDAARAIYAIGSGASRPRGRPSHRERSPLGRDRRLLSPRHPPRARLAHPHAGEGCGHDRHRAAGTVVITAESGQTVDLDRAFGRAARRRHRPRDLGHRAAL